MAEPAPRRRFALVFGETAAFDLPPPAPRAHLALLLVAVLPLLVPLPVVVAVVATPTLAILAGAHRSVKPVGPAETMTHRDALHFPLFGRRGCSFRTPEARSLLAATAPRSCPSSCCSSSCRKT